MKIKIKTIEAERSAALRAPQTARRVQPGQRGVIRSTAAPGPAPNAPRRPYAALAWPGTALDARFASEPRFAIARGWHRVGGVA